MKNQQQSLDINVAPHMQTSTNASTSLSIPEQTVRRHSIGSAVASASIVERLQEIAAQNKPNDTPNNVNETKNVGMSTSNKTQPSRAVSLRNAALPPNRPAFVSANRGRGTAIRGRGAMVTNSGTKPVRPVYLNNIQNKRTSNPDLATTSKGNNGEGVMLKPIANQIAARRFSSEIGITDSNNYQESNQNQGTSRQESNLPGSDYVVPGSLNLQTANLRENLGRYSSMHILGTDIC